MKLTKLEAAVVQLEVAISLFLQEDYLSSLTLAGAAEEILGSLCKKAGKPVAVDHIINIHWKETDITLPDQARRKTLHKLLNGRRNAAKHANDINETEIVIDQYDPLQMIMRAMPMASSLGLLPRSEREMLLWIQTHPEALEL